MFLQLLTSDLPLLLSSNLLLDLQLAMWAWSPQKTPRSMAEQEAEAAGRAVAAGAIVAGNLNKRSDWLKSWNRRFFVLTTETLVWYSPSEARSVALHSHMKLTAQPDGVLKLELGPASDPSAVYLSAASEAELRSWHGALRSLLDALQSEGRVARLHVRENASRFAAPPFAEHPHCGSRNARERRLTKAWYACGREPRFGQPPRPPARPGGAPPRSPPADVIFYLMRLPPAAAAWTGQLRRAFRDVMRGLDALRHPNLAPTLLADVMPDVGRAAVYRPLIRRGSLKDVIHRVVDPRAARGAKYAGPTLPGAPPSAATLASGGGSPGGAAGAAGGAARRPPAALSPGTVSRFGRQILEALRTLRDAGIPCPHLHSGNILVDALPDGGLCCQLSEFECGLFVAAPPLSDTLAQPHAPIDRSWGCGSPTSPGSPRSPLGVAEGGGEAAARRPAECPSETPGEAACAPSVEIVCFGRVLYEMISARELTPAALDAFARSPLSAPNLAAMAEVWELVRRIFLPRPQEGPPPSVTTAGTSTRGQRALLLLLSISATFT